MGLSNGPGFSNHCLCELRREKLTAALVVALRAGPVCRRRYIKCEKEEKTTDTCVRLRLCGMAVVRWTDVDHAQASRPVGNITLRQAVFMPLSSAGESYCFRLCQPVVMKSCPRIRQLRR